MYEKQLYNQGYRHILGMDEAGRGAWAGPVSVGAVCLPLGLKDLRKQLPEVRDSKIMTPLQRERMVEKIKEHAVAWGVGSASNSEIDEIGINPATRLAMQRALDDALKRFPKFKPDCLFLDAMIWPEKLKDYPQITMVDGDARSFTVAAASIIAKTWRDQIMRDLDEELPQYNFGTHKGYGTGSHHSALKTYGLSPFHRTSYAPIRKLIEQGNGD
jgi:ribonuclease HII